MATASLDSIRDSNLHSVRTVSYCTHLLGQALLTIHHLIMLDHDVYRIFRRSVEVHAVAHATAWMEDAAEPREDTASHVGVDRLNWSGVCEMSSWSEHVDE